MSSPSYCTLLQQPVLPVRLLRRCSFTLHNVLYTNCLPGCSSPLSGAPAAVFPCCREASGLEWAKEAALAPVEGPGLPLKVCDTNHFPKHRLEQSSASKPDWESSGFARGTQGNMLENGWQRKRRANKKYCSSSLQRAMSISVPCTIVGEF